MKDLNLTAWIAMVALIIGGFNWGLVGLFNLNILLTIFGFGLARICFILIGVAAAYFAYQMYLERAKKPLPPVA